MSSTMQNIRAKFKRKLSIREDPNPNLDDNYEADDIDEETTGHLHREIEKAEAEGHPYGRPGSFLNKLIMHGNSKTEREIQEALAKDQQAEQAAKTAMERDQQAKA